MQVASRSPVTLRSPASLSSEAGWTEGSTLAAQHAIDHASDHAPHAANHAFTTRHHILRSPCRCRQRSGGERVGQTTCLAAQHATDNASHEANQTCKWHRLLQSPSEHPPIAGGAGGIERPLLAAQHATDYTAHKANQTFKRHHVLQSSCDHVPITADALQRIGLGWTVGFEPTNTRATTWRPRPLGDAHRGRPPRSSASRLGMALQPVNRATRLRRSLSERAASKQRPRRLRAAAKWPRRSCAARGHRGAGGPHPGPEWGSAKRRG